MLICDFCKKEVLKVFRVALDKNYDRLSIPHKAKYACAECSKEKEERRVGIISDQ